MLEDYIKESMKLDEMAMYEMSLQNPARIIEKHISYNNKYSIQDIQNLFNLSFKKVYNEDYPHIRFSRAIKGIADILLSDFESDIDEWGMNIGLEEEDAEEILAHYNKYINLFKNFYKKCEAEAQVTDDKEGIGLKDSVKSAYDILQSGIRDFITKEYPTVKNVLSNINESMNLNEERFTNGTLEDFDPAELMKKVMQTGQSLHTIRTFGDKIYYITIFYEDWFGPKGEDNPDTHYWADIVSEDADGNQERINIDGRNLISSEIIDVLNDWKNSVVGFRI